MKKIFLTIVAGALATPAFSARHDPVKIEVVAPSEDRAIKVQGGGLIGAIAGARTTDVVFMVNALIHGDHARLKCFENHRGCTALGPGTYDAEMDQEKGDIWILIVAPVSHRVIRDHWRVSGTW